MKKFNLFKEDKNSSKFNLFKELVKKYKNDPTFKKY